MPDHQRRVWRAAPATLAVVTAFALASGVAVPVLAYLVYLRDRSPLIPSLLGVLTLVALAYAWRFGLHPRLIVSDSGLVVKNPFSTHRIDWDDVTLVAPGENGLIIGTEEQQVEAWCIQKSNYATRRGHRTRADAISHRLLDLLDERDPGVEHPATGLRIRRARPDESELLARMERSAGEAELSHVFRPETYAYPAADVQHRWTRILHDRLVRVRVLEVSGEPVGFVAFDADTVRHLGVVPGQTRRGYGTALLEYATREIFDSGAAEAWLWVLTANETARAFYRFHGWSDTDELRDCEFPPYPEEIRLRKRNPSAPRRSRVR
jgi:GNAT superfamily N-acetyltransferase